MFIKNHAVSILLASTFLSTPVLADSLDDLKNLPGMSSSIKWGEYEGGSASAAPSGSINLGSEEEPNTVFYKYENESGNTLYKDKASISAAAISNKKTIDNIMADFVQNKTGTGAQTTYGAGIKNNGGGKITSIIQSNFVQNSSQNYGAAITNRGNAAQETSIGKVEKSNFVQNESNEGGAVANISGTTFNAKIGEINESNFIGNIATVNGGAILNIVQVNGKGVPGTGKAIIDKIENSNFYGNEAGEGGAICNSSNGGTGTAEITNIANSNFIGNKADKGGAVYNEGTIGTISESNFLKNSGNAIENHGTITEIVNSSFQENKGSAIYSDNDIKVTANNGAESLFDANETAFNIAGADAKLTLNVEDGGVITVNDKITGSAAGYNLDITSSNGAEVNLNNEIENARITQNGNVSLTMDWKNITDKNNSLALNDGNLTWENVDGALKLNAFDINGGMLTISQLGSKASIEAPTMNLKSGYLQIANADVDLAAEQMGHLKADTLNMDTAMNIGIEKFTLLSDAANDKTSITFLEATQKNGELTMEYSKDELQVTTTAKEAVAPVYKYTVNYYDAAGSFEFERFKVETEDPNPEKPIDPENPTPGGDDNKPDDNKPNHGVVDKEYKIYNEGAFANDVFSLSSLNTQIDVINQAVDLSSLQDLDYSKGRFWATPYYNNSTMNYKNFYGVDSENYGVVAGLDSKAYDYGKMTAVYTVFGAYNSGEDKYQGIHVDNRSWVAGLKASVYRGGFYGDALVNYAKHDAELKTAFGKDDVDTEGYGAALRAGYVLETSTWLYDTSVMLNWQTVEGNNYKSVSSANVATDDYSRLTLTPQLKVGYKAAEGFTPYALVRYHATLSEDGNSIVNDIALSEIENRDSVEYGFGFETKQDQKHSLYAHILRQDGGQEGWKAQAGYKYNF